jgi:hypothetical protein
MGGSVAPPEWDPEAFLEQAAEQAGAWPPGAASR